MTQNITEEEISSHASTVQCGSMRTHVTLEVYNFNRCYSSFDRQTRYFVGVVLFLWIIFIIFQLNTTIDTQTQQL